ncbi:hypothetical protein MHU86_16628 [Fragilaria crotonensis]|nr:hypothetical protein MHU86_16628 [Fragilaria crotonensis]
MIASIGEEFKVVKTKDDENKQLQEDRSKLPTIPSFDMNFSADSSNLWEDSDVLPQWMKDYFAWHQLQRSRITQENWKAFQYCVMRCLDTDNRCGGAADRIKTVPLILYWAARTNRILMIYWSRPTSLESFLLPPAGGIDWRVPDWMVQDVVRGRPAGNVARLPAYFINGTMAVALQTKLQSYNGGSLFNNENIEGPRFEHIFHDMWRTMFTPSLPIQKIIQQHLDMFNLRPGEYAAAHVRGLYGNNNWTEQLLFTVAENAINCASNLRPQGPIYVASDSKCVVDHILGNIAPRKTTKIVALKRDYEPLHLEKASKWRDRQASEYYDTFVDLYLIALSSCVTYNIGGFGEWGLWISRNSSCFIRHGKPTSPVRKCDWSGLASPQYSRPADNESMFLPPMAAAQLAQ